MPKREIKTTLALDGEAKFKQELAAASRELRVLGSETRANTLAFGENAKSIQGLTQRNKDLQAQAKQQKVIVEALTRAVADAASKYGEADKRTDGYRIKLNNAQASLSRTENEIQKNNKAIGEMSDKWKKAGEGAEKASKKLESTGKALTSIGDKITAVSAGIVAGAAALVVNTAAYADEILTLSDQTGIATDKLQEYRYVAELVDVSLETITSSQARQIRSMKQAQDGTKLAVDAYKALKVDAIDPVTGSLRDSETVFWEVIDALGRIENETERDALAMQLMGRSAQDLNPLIKAGADRMRELAQEAQKAGYVMSGETLATLGEYDNKLQRLKLSAEIAKRELALEALPLISEGTEALTDVVRDLAEWVGNLSEKEQENILKIGAWVTGTGLALSVAGRLATGISGLVGMFGSLSTAISTAGGLGAVLSGPAGWVALGTVALGGMAIAVANNVKHYQDLTKEARELDSAMATASSQFTDANNTFSETTAEVTAAANMAQQYIGRLEELEKAGLNTTESQEEYARIVELLQEIIPDLSIEIDAQTGKIIGGTQALWENTKAWKDNAIAQALQAKVQGQVEAYADAMLELTKAENELAVKQDSVNAKSRERQEIWQKMLDTMGVTEQEYAKLAQSGTGIYRGVEAGKLIGSTGELGKAYNSLGHEIGDLETGIDALEESVGKHEKTVKELAEELSITEEAAQKMLEAMDYTEPTQKAAEAVQKLGDAAKAVGSTSGKALAEGVESGAEYISQVLEVLINEGFKKTASAAIEQSREMALEVQRQFSGMADNILINLSQIRVGTVDTAGYEDIVKQVENMSQQALQQYNLYHRDALIRLEDYHEAAGTIESEEYAAELERLNGFYNDKISMTQRRYGEISSIISQAMMEGREVTTSEWRQMRDILDGTTADMVDSARRMEAQIAVILTSSNSTEMKKQGEDILAILETGHNDQLNKIRQDTQEQIQALIGAYERGEITNIDDLKSQVAQVRQTEEEMTAAAYNEHTARMNEYQEYWDSMGLIVDQETGMLLEKTKSALDQESAQHKEWAETEAEIRSESWYDIGAQSVSGLVAGIDENKGKAIEAAANLAKAIDGQFRMQMQMHSPSKVAEGWGENIDTSLADSMIRNLNKVQNASLYLAGAIQPPVARAGFSSGSIGSINNTVPIEIHIHGPVTQDTLYKVEGAANRGVTKALQGRGVGRSFL